jgi:GNAT superfamily N-acetyltransferase
MRISEITQPLEFRIENIGYHHGQSDNRLVAYREGQEVGYIEFSEYEGQPYVAMISVSPEYRRQGIGTALVHRLQAEYPGVEINMSTPTEMGAKLFGSIPHTIHRNKEYDDLKARLAELQAQEQKFQAMADAAFPNPTEEARQRIYAIHDQWNAVNDEIFQIERRLVDMTPSTRVFQAR